jgi:hypothetical protein
MASAQPLLDAAGRRRSPATTPGFRASSSLILIGRLPTPPGIAAVGARHKPDLPPIAEFRRRCPRKQQQRISAAGRSERKGGYVAAACSLGGSAPGRSPGLTTAQVGAAPGRNFLVRGALGCRDCAGGRRAEGGIDGSIGDRGDRAMLAVGC